MRIPLIKTQMVSSITPDLFSLSNWIAGARMKNKNKWHLKPAHPLTHCTHFLTQTWIQRQYRKRRTSWKSALRSRTGCKWLISSKRVCLRSKTFLRQVNLCNTLTSMSRQDAIEPHHIAQMTKHSSSPTTQAVITFIKGVTMTRMIMEILFLFVVLISIDHSAKLICWRWKESRRCLTRICFFRLSLTRNLCLHLTKGSHFSLSLRERLSFINKLSCRFFKQKLLRNKKMAWLIW